MESKQESSEPEVVLSMRCVQCGHPNPDTNKFCGTCGLKLEPVAIDDRDPLELEAGIHQFEGRRLCERQQSAQIKEQGRHREFVRDIASQNSSIEKQTARPSTAAAENLPPTSVEEEMSGVARRRGPAANGIAGPSFLGLSYESGNDRGFVYDRPGNDGFIYETDGDAPEYLLEEVPQRSSWRAVALFALLLVGADLAFVRWRASHNQGPDIAAILAGNGATVDPSGPVMTGNNAKPAPKKAEPPAAQSSDSDSNADSGSSDGPAATTSSNAEEASRSSAATAKTPKKYADSNSADLQEANASTGLKDSREAAKPESDGPVVKAVKSRPAKLAPAEARVAQPKPLGEKDPLIVEADRYLHGRGVRQDCARGIYLLHRALSAGNPAADVKMGALYWSGSCVTQSNLTAYQWFSRAHALEPQNRWIEHSRNSLWASLSSEEKRRVRY